MKLFTLKAKVNGKPINLTVDPRRRLLDVLREDLGFTGVKEGCGEGECGACTVLFNGKPVNSCMILAPEANGSEITTIEGMAPEGTLHPIQEAFLEAGAVQCGYCTPGMVLSAKALLDGNRDPDEGEIKIALSGNLCRCTGYTKIFKAVHLAAQKLSLEEDAE
jgi:carbon-monoxide dehydrogenase small subunit